MNERAGTVSCDSPCALSVVVPVFREEGIINDLLSHLRRLDPVRKAEIIVVDGDPQSRTLDVVEDDGVVLIASPRGRGPQMNAGAAAARGEILLFLHADTTLPPGGLEMIHEAMRDSGVVGGAFRLAFDSNRLIYRLMARVVSIRTNLNKMPYGDQGVFVRRRYFDAIGGFAPVPIMEDVDLARRIRRLGGQLKILDSAVITSRRRMEAEGIVRGVTRNVIITLLYNLGVSPARLAPWYRDDYRLQSQETRRNRNQFTPVLRQRSDR